jgi:hypothetical protein
MIKRIRWIITGVALGVGGSAWVKRKARAAGARFGVAGVTEAATKRARQAFEEGRSTMRQREAELRGGAGSRGGRGPGRP